MQELDATLIGNLRNPHLTKIHLVAALKDDVDDGNEGFRPVSVADLIKRGFHLPGKARESKRIVFLSSSGRPTVQNMIRYANENLCPGAIMVRKIILKVYP